MINYKRNSELLLELDEHVVGHITAKKALINLINRSKIRYNQKYVAMEHKDYHIPPAKCLLIGGSGTGKTYLVESLQKILQFPLVKIDATRLTITSAGDGIKSTDVIDMIKEAAKKAYMTDMRRNPTVEAAIDQTVVFVDEIDKLAWGAKGESDSWNKRTQANFLQIFENSDELSGVSFIFAGAFSDMERMKDVKKMLGFVQTDDEKASEADIIDDLVVKYGLIPELVGRITAIVELDAFTADNYRDILVQKLIPRKLEELIYFNCADLNLSEEDIEKVVAKAVISKQGIRFLKRELDKLCLDIEFNYETIADSHHLLLSNLIADAKEE